MNKLRFRIDHNIDRKIDYYVFCFSEAYLHVENPPPFGKLQFDVVSSGFNDMETAFSILNRLKKI